MRVRAFLGFGSRTSLLVFKNSVIQKPCKRTPLISHKKNDKTFRIIQTGSFLFFFCFVVSSDFFFVFSLELVVILVLCLLLVPTCKVNK